MASPTPQSIKNRYRIGGEMPIQTSHERPLLEIRRATLLSDGSVAIHFRDGNGAWDTVVSAPGSMIADRFIASFEYAEDE